MTKKKVLLTTDDDFEITSYEFNPSQPAQQNILIAAATGVAQKFYFDFAEFLAEQGYKAITFDFRDIGESRGNYPISKSQASFSNWALKDFKVVFEKSLNERNTFVIGHSFGALAFGLQERASEAIGLFGFGTGSGWSGYMHFLERTKVNFMWNWYSPLIVKRYGYLPKSYSGFGSDIPLEVYKEWKKWCSQPHFWFDDPSFPYRDRFEKTQGVPMKIIISSDDPWTTLSSARSYYDSFNPENTEYLEIDTKELSVGHVGYFKKKSKDLFWSVVLEWLKEHSKSS